MTITDSLPSSNIQSTTTSVDPEYGFCRRIRFGLATRAVLWMAVMGAITMVSLAYYFYRENKSAVFSHELERVSQVNYSAALRFNARINFAGRDTQFLSKTPPITGILRARVNGGIDPADGTSEALWHNRLVAIFSAMLQSRPEYQQIRFIGLADGGREIVRVERLQNDQIRQTPPNLLQRKGNRIYFKEAILLTQGEVAVSNIDLNQEFGAAQEPYVPTVRMSTPVFDAAGKVAGLVVVNVGIEHIFRLVNQILGPSHLNLLTNERGDYLFQPNREKTFGFERGRRFRIQDDMPALSSVYEGPDSSYSQVINLKSKSYFASAFRVHFDPAAPTRFVVLATLWPESDINNQIATLRRTTALIVCAILLAGVAILLGLSWLLVRPLREITNMAHSVANGNRDFDLRSMMRRSDETGELARAFNAMIQKIDLREKELDARADALQRSNQELAQFAYIASHDLQEPLRMVGSYLGLLARRYRGKLDAEADEFIGYAVEGAERMKRLINDLLAYSRVSNRPLDLEPVDTGQVVANVVKLLSDRIAENNAEISIGLLPEIEADPTQMERLFLNLIDNAIKYRGEAAPHIAVSAEQHGEFWEFSIEDNGIGIPPEFRDRVFEIFTRLHGREKYQGTGIGLASCRRIVERHGGQIWIESAPGGGSIFHFLLPAIPTKEEGNDD